MPRALCLLPLFALLLACGPRVQDRATRQDGYPSLLPLPVLLAGADAPSRAVPAQTELDSRAAALRAKADALRARPVE